MAIAKIAATALALGLSTVATPPAHAQTPQLAQYYDPGRGYYGAPYRDPYYRAPDPYYRDRYDYRPRDDRRSYYPPPRYEPPRQAPQAYRAPPRGYDPYPRDRYDVEARERAETRELNLNEAYNAEQQAREAYEYNRYYGYYGYR